MAKQDINIGTGPDTHDGDKIRDAFVKVNANTTELYDIKADKTDTNTKAEDTIALALKEDVAKKGASDGYAPLVGGKVPVANLPDAIAGITVVNDLTTGSTTDALSAEQGKALKTAQDLKANQATTYTKTEEDNAHGLLQVISEKAQNSGYAPLDATGIVPAVHLPSPTSIPNLVFDTVALMLAGSAAVKKGDRVAVLKDTDPTKDGEYIALKDAPTVIADYKHMGDAVPTHRHNGSEVDVTIDGKSSNLNQFAASIEVVMGDLKKDGTVAMDEGWIPTEDQDVPTKLYVDDEIKIAIDSHPGGKGDLLADGSVSMKDNWVPENDQDISTKLYVDDEIKILADTRLGRDDPHASMVKGYSPTEDQDISTKLYVDDEIKIARDSTPAGKGDLLADGSVPMKDNWVPENDQDIPTKLYVDDEIKIGNDSQVVPGDRVEINLGPTDPADKTSPDQTSNLNDFVAALATELKGILKDDGSVTMSSNYVPMYDHDILTKSYVDARTTILLKGSFFPIPHDPNSLVQKEGGPRDKKEGTIVLQGVKGQLLITEKTAWIWIVEDNLDDKGIITNKANTWYKIFDFGSGKGDLLADGSVAMEDGYLPIKNQDISTKLYVDDEIKISADTHLGRDDPHASMVKGYSPTNDQDITTKLYVDDEIKITRDSIPVGKGDLLSDGSIALDAWYSPDNDPDLVNKLYVDDEIKMLRDLMGKSVPTHIYTSVAEMVKGGATLLAGHNAIVKDPISPHDNGIYVADKNNPKASTDYAKTVQEIYPRFSDLPATGITGQYYIVEGADELYLKYYWVSTIPAKPAIFKPRIPLVPATYTAEIPATYPPPLVFAGVKDRYVYGDRVEFDFDFSSLPDILTDTYSVLFTFQKLNQMGTEFETLKNHHMPLDEIGNRMTKDDAIDRILDVVNYWSQHDSFAIPFSRVGDTIHSGDGIHGLNAKSGTITLQSTRVVTQVIAPVLITAEIPAVPKQLMTPAVAEIPGKWIVIFGANQIRAEKGNANGYAPLDADSKVPVANLPTSTSYTKAEADTAHGLLQVVSEKAAANGYAPLDTNSKVPSVNLPTSAATPHHIFSTQAIMLAYAPTGTEKPIVKGEYILVHGDTDADKNGEYIALKNAPSVIADFDHLGEHVATHRHSSDEVDVPTQWADGIYKKGSLIVQDNCIYIAKENVAAGEPKPGEVYLKAFPPLGSQVVTAVGYPNKHTYAQIKTIIGGSTASIAQWSAYAMVDDFNDADNLFSTPGVTHSGSHDVIWTGYPDLTGSLAAGILVKNGWAVIDAIGKRTGRFDVTAEVRDTLFKNNWKLVAGTRALLIEETINTNNYSPAPISGIPGEVGTLVLTQDSTGNHTVVFPSSYKIVGGTPVVSLTANSKNVFRYTMIGTDVLIEFLHSYT